MIAYGKAASEVLRIAETISDNCIIGPFSLTKKGYPQVRWAGRVRKVTHVLMELAGRDRPPGMVYCHSDICNGDRRCVNISHGRWDSQAANIADAVRLDRTLRGEAHQNSKLSDADVWSIREVYAAGGRTQASIADQWGVSASLVSMITSGVHR